MYGRDGQSVNAYISLDNKQIRKRLLVLTHIDLMRIPVTRESPAPLASIGDFFVAQNAGVRRRGNDEWASSPFLASIGRLPCPPGYRLFFSPTRVHDVARRP